MDTSWWGPCPNTAAVKTDPAYRNITLPKRAHGPPHQSHRQQEGWRLSSRSTLLDTSLYFPPAPESVHPIYLFRHSRDCHSGGAVPLGVVVSHYAPAPASGGFYKKVTGQNPASSPLLAAPSLFSWAPFPSPRYLGPGHFPTTRGSGRERKKQTNIRLTICTQATKSYRLMWCSTNPMCSTIMLQYTLLQLTDMGLSYNDPVSGWARSTTLGRTSLAITVGSDPLNDILADTSRALELTDLTR